jgi:hypothetical protein
MLLPFLLKYRYVSDNHIILGCPLLHSYGLKANVPLHLKRLCLCLLPLVSNTAQKYILQVLKFMVGVIGWLL